MRFWNWLTRKRSDRGWPGYIINGRIRTSTAGLIVAFFVLSWLHNTYQPAAQTPTAPETAVVPPGFVPDPEYTWVPRTQVQERPRTTTSRTPTTTTQTPTTTTPTTTETSPGDTTSSTPTSPTSPTSDGAPTTVVDPDGPGPLPPSTLGPSSTTPPNAPGLPFPLPGIAPPTTQPPR